MTDYATIKQLEFMQKLGFQAQPADLTKEMARRMISEKLEKNGVKQDAPVMKVELDEEIMKEKARWQKPNGNDDDDPLEFQIRSREVRCRALESAIEYSEKIGLLEGDQNMVLGMVLGRADKFVEWIYGK